MEYFKKEHFPLLPKYSLFFLIFFVFLMFCACEFDLIFVSKSQFQLYTYTDI